MSKESQRTMRENRVKFAVGMAAIDGGKPTPYTESLLRKYESRDLSASALCDAVLSKYASKA